MRNACPSYALVYATILPTLQSIAREHGYALAVHGSMATDLDLVAIPWVEDALAPELMIEAIREKLVGWFPPTSGSDGAIVTSPVAKPHGRLAWALHFDHTDPMHVSTRLYSPYLDISVMPRNTPPMPRSTTPRTEL